MTPPGSCASSRASAASTAPRRKQRIAPRGRAHRARTRAGPADRDAVQGLQAPRRPGAGAAARSRGADPRRADRRARPQPEARGAQPHRRAGAAKRRSSSRPISSKRSTRCARRAIIIAGGKRGRRRHAGRARGALAPSQCGAADRSREPAIDARTALMRLPGVAAVETVEDGEGKALLIVPQEGRSIIAEVTDLVRTARLAGRGAARRARPARRRVPRHHHRRRHEHRSRSCAAPASSSAASSRAISRRRSPISSSSSSWRWPGTFAFFIGNFFDRGQADLQPFFQLPSLALSRADPGARDAALGRGAQERHDRAVPDPADLDRRRRCWASSSPPGRSPASR